MHGNTCLFHPFACMDELGAETKQGFACSLVEAKPLQLRSHLDAFHGIFGEALLGDGRSPTETAGVKD